MAQSVCGVCDDHSSRTPRVRRREKAPSRGAAGDRNMNKGRPKTSSATQGVAGSHEGAQAIARSAAILELVGDSGETSARLSEIAAAAGLVATACRILHALVAAGLLSIDKHRYKIGPAIFSLAVRRNSSFVRRNRIEAITTVTGDTVLFLIRAAELIEGVHGIAVPAVGEDGTEGAISVAAVADRLGPDRRLEIAETIRQSPTSVSGLRLPARASAI
jgi:DNA-binding IclR family transcriptional regulator